MVIIGVMNVIGAVRSGIQKNQIREHVLNVDVGLRTGINLECDNMKIEGWIWNPTILSVGFATLQIMEGFVII